MAFFDRTKIITSVLIFSVALSGCSIPFFGKGNRISPDSVYDALSEYDCEDYDDLEEMAGDAENKRALMAGMFISLEGKYIRHALNDDTFNGLFEPVSEDYLYNLYSKSINKATLMIRGEENRDGGTVRLAILSAEFDDDEAAWKYYNSCNDLMAGLTEDEKVQSYKDHFEDGKLECTATQIFSVRSASCQSVYIEGSSVMVMTGYEDKCNDITDEFEEYAGILEIPYSDMSRWDCLAVPDVEDRILLMIDELDMEYLDPEEFSDRVDLEGQVLNIYTEGTDPSIMTGIEDIYSGYEDQISMIRAAYTMPSGYTAFYAFSFTLDGDVSASYLYEHAVTELMEENDEIISNTDTGETGGITYTKLYADNFSHIRYSIFLEGNMVYLIGAISLQSDAVDDLYEEYSDILGLP